LEILIDTITQVVSLTLFTPSCPPPAIELFFPAGYAFEQVSYHGIE
jgi:hypothetical protein